jgi:TM2 domain-containing membrane protein YozV
MHQHWKSRKSWLVLFILALLFGAFGVHRFYAGKIGTGILMFFTFGGFGIWYIIDLLIIITGNFTDSNGNIISVNSGRDDDDLFSLKKTAAQMQSAFSKERKDSEAQQTKRTQYSQDDYLKYPAFTAKDTGSSSNKLLVSDEIGKLHDLMQRGVITPEEFETQKKKLLSY